jgi:trimeric autotransporter adhesin
LPEYCLWCILIKNNKNKVENMSERDINKKTSGLKNFALQSLLFLVLVFSGISVMGAYFACPVDNWIGNRFGINLFSQCDNEDAIFDQEIAVLKKQLGDKISKGFDFTDLQGEKGDKGDSGNAGVNGINGSNGIQGIQGIAGVNGTNGNDGATGVDGATGSQGIQGIQGISGVLSVTNDTNITGSLSGTDLTLGWNGVLAANRGGTGLSNLGIAGQVLAVNSGATGLEYIAIPAAPVNSVFGRTGLITAQNGDYTTNQVTEGTNLYYTDIRSRNALSIAGTPLTYNPTTGVFGINQANTTQDGYLSSSDWNLFNSKQDQLTAGAGISTFGNTITNLGLLTADNGLTNTSGVARLGGTLLQDTVIEQNGNRFVLTNSTANTFPINDATFDIVSRTGTTLRLYSETTEAAIGTTTNSPISLYTNNNTNFPNASFYPGGDIRFWLYPNSRNDAGGVVPTNFLYTTTGGLIQSAPTSLIAGGSLNNAYNFGGTALGRTINIDGGQPVLLKNTSDGESLRLESNNGAISDSTTLFNFFGTDIYQKQIDAGTTSLQYGLSDNGTNKSGQFRLEANNNNFFDINSQSIGTSVATINANSLARLNLNSSNLGGTSSLILNSNTTSGFSQISLSSGSGNLITAATGQGLQLQVNGNLNALTAANNGNIGIGTITPGAKLEVNSGISNTSGFRLTNLTSATPGAGGSSIGVDALGNIIRVSGNDSILTYNGLTKYGAGNLIGIGGTLASNTYITTGGSEFGLLNGLNYFKVDGTGAILNTGNNGFGVTIPTERVDIGGNLKFSNALMPAGLAGTTGQILVSQGSGTAPIWSTPSISGNLENAYNFGGSGTGKTINISPTSGALTLQSALNPTSTELLQLGNNNYGVKFTQVGAESYLSNYGNTGYFEIGASSLGQLILNADNGKIDLSDQGVKIISSTGPISLSSNNSGYLGFGSNSDRAIIYSGSGTPENSLIADGGSIYLRNDGITENQQLYIKTGDGTSSGWSSINPTCTTCFVNDGNSFGGLTTLGTNDAQDLVFETNGADRLRITQTGRLVFSNTNGGNTSLYIGRNAGNEATGGGSNTAIGSFTLTNNTNGFSNTAVGMSALTSNTVGTDNSAFGKDSQALNQSGSFNSSFGVGSLGFNTSGSENTAIGTYALRLTAGNNNTGLGRFAGDNLQNGNNNIAIGAYTNFVNINGSNQLNLGNAIFGTGLTGTVGSPAGLIGIGVNTPSSALDINGATTSRGVGTPGLSLAGTGRIYFDNTDNKYKCSENGLAYFDCYGGSTARLNNITAANGTNTIANGNFGQTWNWNLVGATNGLALGEAVSSSGTGNILQVGTVAGSLAKPLQVLARGNTVLDVANSGNLTLGNTTANSAITLQTGTGALNLGNDAFAKTISIGNTTGTTGIIQRVGTGNYSLDGVGASTYSFGSSTTTGTITVGGAAQTGTTTIGSSTAVNTINLGTGTGATALNIGNNNTGAVNIGSSANSKAITVGNTTGTTSLNLRAGTGSINTQGAFLYNTIAIGNLATGGNIGTAAATVDIGSSFNVAQSTAGQTITLPNPTTTTAGRIIYVQNTGTVNFDFFGVPLTPNSSRAAIWNGSGWNMLTANGGVVGATPLSSISAATAANTINNAGSTQTWNWNGATTSNGLVLTGNALTTGNILTLTGGTFTSGSALNITNVGGAGIISNTPGIDLTTPAGNTLQVISGTTGAATFDSGTTGAVNIGTSNNAKTVNVGTGAAVANTINLGGTGANTVNIANNQNAGAVNVGNNLTTGTVSIATGANTGILSIATGAGAQTINFATGAAAKNVTVGSLNTTSTLTLQGGGSAGGRVAAIAGSGGVELLPASTGWTAISDKTAKENLVVVDDALGKIQQLTGYNYNYLAQYADPSVRHNGLLAQDVQKVLPDAVGTLSNGKLGVQYDQITALTVNAIKELDTKVNNLTVDKTSAAALKSVIDSLDTRVTVLEKELEEIKARPIATDLQTNTPTNWDQIITQYFAKNDKLFVSADGGRVVTLTVDKDLIVNGDIRVKGNLIVNGDTAFEVTIPAGETVKKVVFDTAKTNKPVITATPTDFVDGAFAVKNITASDFDLVVEKPQAKKITFNVISLNK